ncbi:4-hydroxybenzoate octaprenyltransferase [Sinirhodobacter sp. WL0062]|uniref:4-hydroxybenzoate octaprenyltransferase n=1 Tax=Rhodobacter flavimaris TaxID=2907145 RepID=A0ABS8Z442_9RHOB|nr:4-hydroxybenzoate octaprenyltransferase [Sinirhodobacter sp. WL0062]MCE5974705.1 4-hydroxybenzoate octaprenyltransferase [Sinirhodobacter sp. WL0062]
MTGTIEKPEPQGQVADAVKGNWVDHYAPAAWRPYLRLSRADRPIGTWLLLLPCWWGIALAAAVDAPRLSDLWLAAGCTIGSVLMRGAGCTWNDITDRNFDGQVARTRSRPIPSGQVTVRQALIWLGVQVAISAMILFTFNWATILLGIAALVPVAIYPFAKRFTWWPQLFLGIAFNWGALVGWVAHSGSLHPAAVLLYLSGLVWTLFYDTIYAHQDKEDDALIGVKSTARLFGEDSARWLNAFLIGAVALMTAAILWALLPARVSGLTLAICVAAPWAFGWHLYGQMRQLNIDDPDNCLRLFRANRDTGLIVALFLAVGAIV